MKKIFPDGFGKWWVGDVMTELRYGVLPAMFAIVWTALALVAFMAAAIAIPLAISAGLYSLIFGG